MTSIGNHTLSRRQLRVSDLHVDTLIAGEGPLVVVLFHGFSESSRSWHSQVEVNTALLGILERIHDCF